MDNSFSGYVNKSAPQSNKYYIFLVPARTSIKSLRLQVHLQKIEYGEKVDFIL